MDSFQHWTEYTRFTIALVAVLDPFFVLPIFLTLTAGRGDLHRKGLAKATAMTVVGVLIGAALFGESLLRLLGTSLASFRVGGGLVLLLMALAMLNAQPGNVRQTAEEANEIGRRDASGVVPLAIPLLAGPAAISMVMIAAQEASWVHRLAIMGCIALVGIVVWITLRLAVPIGAALGATGLNVANRLLGLLLAAIAIETMVAGIRALFPGMS